MLDRITLDPNILAGRATLRGLRISDAHIVNLVANGMSGEEILAELPELEIEDIRQALCFAGDGGRGSGVSAACIGCMKSRANAGLCAMAKL